MRQAPQRGVRAFGFRGLPLASEDSHFKAFGPKDPNIQGFWAQRPQYTRLLGYFDARGFGCKVQGLGFRFAVRGLGGTFKVGAFGCSIGA